MKTLNEQIQRLRDILHTCYESIASKGGTLPPVGERNMTNLPDAVESVPQVANAELEELTITANGEYTPQEGVDGFSKVVAEFDTSSLPKVKVFSFRVDDYALGESDTYDMRIFDYNVVRSFENTFANCKKIKTLDFDGIDTSNIVTFYYAFGGSGIVRVRNANRLVRNACRNLNNIFMGCSNLEEVDTSEWDTSNVTNIAQFFHNCNKLKSLNFLSWNCGKVLNADEFKATNCETLVGNKTIDDIIQNNLTILKDFGYIERRTHLGFKECPYLNRASIRAFINGVADRTNMSAGTIYLHSNVMAKLTEEDIAIATNKNWTIA